MKLVDYKSKIKEHGLVLLLFAVLTFIFTYPAIAHLTTHTASIGVDAFVRKWQIWHISEVLRGGGGISDIYHSNLLFYPHGASLEWSDFSLTSTLFLAFPFTLITDNLVLIYNILFLFHFIVAGYAMYLLVRYLVKDKTTAFLVGFAYTFSSMHMAWGEAGYLHMMSFLWVPLFFLFFFKIFKEQSIKNPIMAAIFLFFLSLDNWYYLLFVFSIAIPYFIYKIINAPSLFNKCFLLRIALLLFLFIIVVFPFVHPMMVAYFGEEEYLMDPVNGRLSFIHYILSNRLHPFWGHGGDINAAVSPGYLVIFLSLLYVIKTKKHLFWFSLAIFFLLFSVDPLGVVPTLLGYIPLVNMIGVTSRFAFVVLFSLLLLFAFSLNYFLSSFFISKRKLRTVLFVVIFFILATEYFVFPFPTTYYRNRQLGVQAQTAQEVGLAVKGPHPILGEDFSVLDFPYFYAHPEKYNFYFQTFHQKPIFGGHIARPKLAELATLEEYQRIFHEYDEISPAESLKQFQEFLKKYRVGYIIFYEDEYISWYNLERARAMAGENSSKVKFLLEQSPLRLLPKPVNENLGIHIYEVLPERYSDIAD